MESWRMVWRAAVEARKEKDGWEDSLKRLAEAVAKDDPRLIQGGTTNPPPLLCVQDWICESADAMGWLWLTAGLVPADQKAVTAGFPTVGEVEEGFARGCFECDARMDEPAACRWFLNAWDDTPRTKMLALMAAELAFNLGTGPDPVAGK